MRKLRRFTILEGFVTFMIIALLIWQWTTTVFGFGLSIVRQRNVATTITFPLVYLNNGTLITGAAGLDSELSFANTTSAVYSTFTDLAGEATEIATNSGIYQLNLTAAETDHLTGVVQIKSSTTNSTTQVLPLTFIVGNPNFFATTDDGDDIHTTAGAIDTVTTTATATAVTTLNGIANNVITANSINTGAITNAKFASGAIDATVIATDAIGAAEIAADAGTEIGTAVWATATRQLTSAQTFNITGNLSGSVGSLTTWDKTGYSIADSTSDAVIADAVWNGATATYGSSGTYGLLLETDLDATISSRGTSTLTAANVWDTNISAYSGIKAGTYLKGLYDKLPTNYIMGSAVQTDKDDDIDAILTDTSAVDTSTEIRTLLTGSDTAVSTLVASDNIGINWADITNSTTTVNLANTTISTSQAVASVSGAVGSVTGGVTVTTNNDKTGYTASTVSDKTGYSLTQAFPSNFSSLAITASGNVTSGNAGSGATAQEVWEYANRTLTSAGEGGATAQEVWEYTTRQLTGTQAFNITGNLSGSVGSLTGYVAPSNAVIDLINTTVQDKLDQKISTRMATFTYTAPDNANITAILEDTGTTLPNNLTTIQNDLDNPDQYKANVTNLDVAVSSRLATANYTAPNNTVIGLINATVQENLDAKVSEVGGGTAQDVADAVWNATASNYVGANTTGKKLNEMPTPYDISP